jgi:hypothetical protein
MTNSLFAAISSWIVLVTGGSVLVWAAFEAIWALINLWSRTSKAGREFVQWIAYRKKFQRWLRKQTAERYSRQKSLEDYMRCNLDRNAIDHHLRASIDQKGCVRVYIHPQGVDGDTLDFIIDGDDVIPLKMPCKKCRVVFLVVSPDLIPHHACIPSPPANVPFKKGL